MRYPVPPYFDYLIDAFRRGEGGRFVHLGHWDQPPGAGWSPAAEEFEHAQRRLNEALLKMAELTDGQRVLDVGCGFGGTLERINSAWRDMSLTGVNVDPRQLDICSTIAARNGNALRWEQADACALPFDDARFDRVLCIEAMFHFSSRRRFFTEAARVLRPGGVLVLSDIVLERPPVGAVTPPFSLQDALQAGFGPWPDPWGEDADHDELGRAAGLRCECVIDATANTAPSHRFTTPSNADPRHDPGDDGQRAGLALRWLHEEGLLRYVYVRAIKSGRLSDMPPNGVPS
ncbi:MAG: class I SAM-dependent methyltransferase [Acidobacteriota bacterium]|jgi:SAM-dependent methyltransferase